MHRHVVVAIMLLVVAAPAAANNSVAVPDVAGDVGLYTSLVLDAAGNPVVSQYDATNGDLRVVHCNDPSCDPAVNGPESATSPDTTGDVGRFTSLVLDAAGNPVISYYDATNGDLRVVHCNDPSCDPAVNGPESTTSPDTTGNVGQYTSLSLDAAGNPVISYHEPNNGDLRVVHCNDPNCDPVANGPESATIADAVGYVGRDTSLALDAAGNPVISYADATDPADNDLRVLHCNDPDCDPVANGPESSTAPDTVGDVGRDSSLVLDAAGNPVVSHYDMTNGDLRVVRCNDPRCDAAVNGPESGTSPDTADDVGQHTSLALDAAGNPVISHQDVTNRDLRVVHCNDPNCDPAVNGPEVLTSPDTSRDVGYYTSLVLDAAGNPVISHRDANSGELRVVHCEHTTCVPDEGVHSAETLGDVGYDTSLALDDRGFPVISHHDNTSSDLRVVHCNDTHCLGGDESVTTPDPMGEVGEVGEDTSLVLDAAGNPVISHYDATNGDLRLVHCNDPNCAGDDESAVSVDTGGDVGRDSSLALDASGYPVISYYDAINGDLRVVHCNDPNCAQLVAATYSTPDPAGAAGDVGAMSSLVLDAAGNPVISHYDATNGSLRVVHCNDPYCLGAESVTTPDPATDAGLFPSLALDASGFPVISHRDLTNGDLRVVHCNDPDCAGGDESVTAPDTAGNSGWYSSLVLGAAGNPIISHFDIETLELRVAHCNDPNCDPAANGPERIRVLSTGRYTSMVLDAAGNPVVSHRRATSLGVLRCNDPGCVDQVPPVVTGGPDVSVSSGSSVGLSATGVDPLPDGGTVALQWDLDGDGAFDDATGPSVTFNAAGRAPGTYVVKVRGYDDDHAQTVTDTVLVTVTAAPANSDGGGSSPASPSSPATPVSGGERRPPGAPTDVAATAGARSATVSWSAPASSGTSGLVRYTVTASTGRTFTVDGTPPATSVVVRGLPNDTPVTFTVTATNADGLTGPASDPSEQVTPQASQDPPTGDPTPPADPDARIDEPDPIQFAVDVSQRRFAAAPQPDDGASGRAQTRRPVDTVVLARVDDAADALAGSVLTGDAPLLYTHTDTLPEPTSQEIDRLLGPAGGTVVLLGGSAAISNAVSAALLDDSRSVVRLAGATRIHTALAVADHARAALDTPAATVALARAYPGDGDATSGWADAVTAGAWAAATATPILLSATDTLHADVAAWLGANGITDTVVLGGPAALADAVADATPGPRRVSGPDRHATAAAIAVDLLGQRRPDQALILNTTHEHGWAYGLAAAGLAADLHAPILSATSTAVPDATAELLRSCGTPRTTLTLLGDTNAIPARLADELAELDGSAC